MTNYLINRPVATEVLAISQPVIRDNFNYIALQGNVDHYFVGPTGTAPNGFHRVVHIVNNGGTPGGTANTGGVYTATNGVGGGLQLFYIAPSGSVTQLTNIANTSPGVNGSTTLTDGVFMIWGQGTTNASGDATISFTPNFATFFSASLTRIETGGNNRGFIQFTALPTATGGTVKMRDSGGSGIAGSFLWTAIGTS